MTRDAKMIAARLHRPRGEIVIEEAPKPDPGPKEALLRIQACGLCHSDLFIRSLPELPRTPLTLGHEAIGVVEQVGSGVTQLQPGDRVGLTYLFGSCGNCEACQAGRPELCSKQVNTGYHVDGAFAAYALGREGFLAKVPADLPAERAAPLCCAGWTAHHAVRSTGLQPGSWVAIFGVGGLGHLGVQFARRQGLRVAAVDIDETKLASARSLGAEVTVNAENEDAARALRKATGGAHAAISFVASASAVRQAFGCLRRHGVLALVGLAAGNIDLPLVDVVLKQIRIHGSFLGRPGELRELFEIARQGEIQMETQTCGLEDLPQAMEEMAAGKLSGRRVVTFE